MNCAGNTPPGICLDGENCGMDRDSQEGHPPAANNVFAIASADFRRKNQPILRLLPSSVGTKKFRLN